MGGRLRLGPVEQQELLGDLTHRLLEELPDGWRQLMMDYRQVGHHIDVATGLRQPDGSLQVWEPSDEVWRFFQELRHGMYTDGRGTWFSMRFVLDPPRRFQTIYNYSNLPDWGDPSPEAFALDLDRYPREPDAIPHWFGARASGVEEPGDA